MTTRFAFSLTSKIEERELVSEWLIEAEQENIDYIGSAASFRRTVMHN
uniref:Uncharacterized protein n=1 Tax=Arundo donax TaxID=35708 RepID=A0A0A9GUE1_ARUDO